jgi:hypothetical protein
MNVTVGVSFGVLIERSKEGLIVERIDNEMEVDNNTNACKLMETDHL